MKIQLTMRIDFISSKYYDETSVMHTKSDNLKSLMSNETDEIIKRLFNCPLQKYQEGLEESIKRSEFIFVSVNLLHYK